MLIDESLANIKRTYDFLATNDPSGAPPIVAAPKWWIDEVNTAFKSAMAGPDDKLDTVHGCKVVLNDSLQEPFTISPGGKTYPVLPGWARAANVGKDSVKPVDSIFSVEPKEKP